MAEAGLFTLGVEEEFQIVDPKTRELKSHIQQILEDGKLILAENVKAEMHQSVVEMGTDICRDVKDAREQVTKLRTNLAKLAMKSGLRIAAAGTHPFSHWKDQKITEHPRYKLLLMICSRLLVQI
jgi:carboxylate-amine ligase